MKNKDSRLGFEPAYDIEAQVLMGFKKAAKPRGKSINYARCLALWLTVFHGSEDEFWHRMNLKRFNALYAALQKPRTEERRQSLHDFIAQAGGG